MTKAIIFDCFGVIVGKGFWAVYDIAGGDSVKDAAFIDDILLQANSGAIKPEAFRAQVAAQLGITPEQWEKIVEREEQPNLPILEFIRDELKPQYKIGLLSNANKGTIERKIPAEWRAVFDDIIVSAEVGLVKPDPEIFRLSARNLGVRPDEAVFTDDLTEYLEGAEKTGMQTILYKNLEDFKRQLDIILGKGESQ